MAMKRNGAVSIIVGGTRDPVRAGPGRLRRDQLTQAQRHRSQAGTADLRAVGRDPQTTAPDNSITVWVGGESLSTSQAQAESARLRHIGFVAGISEPLASSTNTDRYGLTGVEQFKTAKGASAELVHALATNGPWTLFTVPGVPGARGFEQDGSAGGRNVAFTHGDDYYIVGSGWQKKAPDGVPRATMIAVAQTLYHHVGG
jgi:hypothetical protein